MRLKSKLFVVLLWPWFSLAQQVGGVNQTIDENFGARYSGLSNTFLGLSGDEASLVNHPAAIGDVNELTLQASHMKKFGLFSYDQFSLVMPYDKNGTMGFGFSRFAGETEERSVGNPDKIQGILGVRDYHFVGAFSRKWGALDVGANLNLLYRKLDQDGLGIRADLSSQYRLTDIVRVGALLKGLLPSSARWESDSVEYEASDLYLGAGVELPSEYFYGVFKVAYQTEGLFQKQSKSESSSRGKRAFDSPIDALGTGNLGVEYNMNVGLSLRLGLAEVARDFADLNPSFGVGYEYKRTFKVDYSFSPHIELESTHRLSISLTPHFAGFQLKRPGIQLKRSEKKTKRTNSTDIKVRDGKTGETMSEPEEELEELEEFEE